MPARVFPIADPTEALLLLGERDRHLRLLRESFGVKVSAREGGLRIEGEEGPVAAAAGIVERLRRRARDGRPTATDEVLEWVAESKATPAPPRTPAGAAPAGGAVPAVRELVTPRSDGQARYLEAIEEHDLTFALGPAGTGKTYLAVAAGVRALRAGEFHRLVLTRPAVEAGERLGFLPGGFEEKVDPYLRPLYDALADFLPPAEIRRNLDRDVFEIAPLAYMRGRTLNDSFIILDEGQNTSVTQMKMFLTRLGARSKTIVTGDVTQVDLPRGAVSGLVHAVEILDGMRGVSVVRLSTADIVRHRLVQDIVDAYAADRAGRKVR
ncbi:MAG: PhoH family protein [Planctomycetales bacterium]|nr:PhoH family protein [Planctomycetales bacterium]